MARFFCFPSYILYVNMYILYCVYEFWLICESLHFFLVLNVLRWRHRAGVVISTIIIVVTIFYMIVQCYLSMVPMTIIRKSKILFSFYVLIEVMLSARASKVYRLFFKSYGRKCRTIVVPYTVITAIRWIFISFYRCYTCFYI